MRRNRVALILMALYMATVLCHSRVLGVSPSRIRLSAQFDVYVSSNNPESCYGRDVVLNVRSYLEGKIQYNHRTYIQFNISVIPKNGIILSANLWLYKNPEGANIGNRNIQAYRVTGAWNEYTLNWTNQPSISSKPTAITRVDGAMKWYGWDLMVDVSAWHAGAALNHGTILRDESEDSTVDYASVFLSREASHPENPYLEVEYAESSVATTTVTGERSMSDSGENGRILAVVSLVAILAGVAWFVMKRRTEKERSQSERLALCSRAKPSIPRGLNITCR